MRAIAIAGILSATAAHADVVLEGKVLGPDGRAVSAAVVVGTLEWETERAPFRIDDIAIDGAFQIAVPGSPRRLQSIHLHARSRGFSRALDVRVVPRGSRGYVPVVLRLRPAVDAPFTVVDAADHRPVPSTTVAIAAESVTEHPDAGTPHPTDATGTATFAAVDMADELVVVAEAPGYVPEKVRAKLDGRPQRIEIARGGRFEARVLDADTGAAVTGCRLWTKYGEITTDGKGRFRALLPFGHVRATATCADYGRDFDLEDVAIDFAEAMVGQLTTLTIRRKHYITGTVMNAAGAVVPGVVVHRVFVPGPRNEPVRHTGDPVDESTTTDGNGNFMFYRSAMDRFELRIEAPRRWAQAYRYAGLQGRIEIRLPP